MLIEQIFELREPGRLCTPITGCFHNKAISLTIISKENVFDWIYTVFTAKILQEAMHFTSLYLGHITYKI